MADLLNLVQGFGDVTIQTKSAPFADATDAAKNVIMIPAFLSANFNTNTNKKTARYQKDGKVVTAKSSIASKESTASLTFENINNDHLAFFVNSQWVTSSNVVWPAVKTAVVPSGTPEITDLDITVANAADVFVYMDSDLGGTTSGALVPTGEAAPAAGEFTVDGATNKIVLNAAQIGASIRYKVPKVYTSGKTLLAENDVKSLGSISWEGEILLEDDKSLGMRVFDMSPSSFPSFEFGDGLVTVTLEFDCNTPSNKPDFFELIDLQSLVV